LYATLHGCTATNAGDGAVEIRLAKKPPGAAASACASAAAQGGEAAAPDDYKARVQKLLEARQAEEYAQVDTVRYGQRDWKERYYSSKLKMPRQDEAARRSVAAHYVQGLCWVLMYYYQGVQDWGWYFPFHYAPCASDLVDLADFAGGAFEEGDAFSPFEQLMSVFPPASGHALPAAYRQLMVDADSPIIDFYPIDFADDLNGKKYAWQAIALLPFIDAPRLRATLAPLRATLTAEEADRDRHGDALLFVSSAQPIGAICAAAAAAPVSAPPVRLDAAAAESLGFGGFVRASAASRRQAGEALPSPPGGAEYNLPPIPACATVGVSFDPPTKQAHIPRLLRGQILPQPTLSKHDQPQFSRDAAAATRSMEARFSSAPKRLISGALGRSSRSYGGGGTSTYRPGR